MNAMDATPPIVVDEYEGSCSHGWELMRKHSVHGQNQVWVTLRPSQTSE